MSKGYRKITMKGIIGTLLLAFGLGATIAVVTTDKSWWIIGLCMLPIYFGIDLLIDEKVEKAKEELREEFNR